MNVTTLAEHEVVARYGLPRSTLRDLIKRGEFPSPIKVGRRKIAWLLSETDAWLASRPRVDSPASTTQGGAQ